MRKFILAVGLGLYPALAAALNYSMFQYACIGGPVPVPPFTVSPIPVGCELVDCCPGCPGMGPVEWRITLDSKMATRAELRFEGLSKAQVDKLEISGAAKREGDRILVSGDARIAGLPQGSGRPAVGMLQPVASRQAAPQAVGSFTDRILVEQFMGPFLVNAFNWTWVPKPCSKPTAPPTLRQDRLKVDGTATGEEVSVLFFHRRNAGCLDGLSTATETTFPTTGEQWLGNVLSAGSCHSEVAVFAKNRAMKWEPLAWTDLFGDVRSVTLEPLIEAKLNIWLVDEADRTAAEEQALKARDLLLDNRVGVRLNWKIENVTTVPGAPTNAVDIVNGGIANDAFLECLGVAAIQAQPSIYAANTLNVYYLRRSVPGRNCAIRNVPMDCITSANTYFAKANANITFIGSDANVTTLVHELGHAYGLRPAACPNGHTTDPQNIMFPSSSTSTVPRTTLTLGQVFRMNTHGDDWGGTMLIQNDLPSRTPRSCFYMADRGCPGIQVGWPP